VKLPELSFPNQFSRCTAWDRRPRHKDQTYDRNDDDRRNDGGDDRDPNRDCFFDSEGESARKRRLLVAHPHPSTEAGLGIDLRDFGIFQVKRPHIRRDLAQNITHGAAYYQYEPVESVRQNEDPGFPFPSPAPKSLVVHVAVTWKRGYWCD